VRRAVRKVDVTLEGARQSVGFLAMSADKRVGVGPCEPCGLSAASVLRVFAYRMK